MRAVFLRILEANDKYGALRAAIGTGSERAGVRYHVAPSTFAAVPGSPFAYWSSESLRRAFTEFPAFESDNRIARIGLTTHDDFQWLRLSWEATAGDRYVPFAKGGQFSRYYADIHLRLPWTGDGRLLKTSKLERLRRGELTENNSKLWNESHYFRPGLTWPRRTSGLSVRAMPFGSIFADKGPAAFVATDDPTLLSALATVMNSRVFASLVALQLARTELAQSFEVGIIRSTPVPDISLDDSDFLAARARRAWSLTRGLDSHREVSHAFVLPALLQVEGRSLAARAEAWAGRLRAIGAELEEIQTEIDERCFDLYGIEEADRRAISEGLAGDADDADVEESVGEVEEADEEPDAAAAADAGGLVPELVSWAVGVAFGRFDVRLATGERELPEEPEPFDPLPVCSPGILAGEDGLPVPSRPPEYPLDFPESGVLVDDPGDAGDLTAAVRAVFDVVFGTSADARWDETAALLDPREHDLRVWFRSGLFERHLKQHSKSRRKAPIMWQLGTPSGRYSVWLYAHRVTGDSFFQLQSDVLAPKLSYEERQLTNLVQGSGGSPSARERRAIEVQEAFVEELRVLLEEVKRVAPLWKPTLDDGIVLVLAPVWRLVSHKPWQRELKKKWSELADGKYDWAQLAMHLWPERVVAKCGEDRSLAIAHGLEDVFWVQSENGKWERREQPTTGIDELIQLRTSTSVKEALRGVA